MQRMKKDQIYSGSRADLKRRLSRFFNTDQFTLMPLSGGASVRRYYMLEFQEKLYFPGKRVVLMDVPLDRLQIADDYLNISYYLRRKNIARPRLYELHRDEGWIFLAPAAGRRVDDYLRRHPEKAQEIYTGLLDFLLDMQRKAAPEKHCPAFRRLFDEEKYRYEFRFHVRQQLIGKFWKYRMSAGEENRFEEFAGTVSRFLATDFPVFVHRDFQSSNIFYQPRKAQNRFQIIDFQDARSGSLVYDVVSLLWDSYVDMPDDLRERLVQRYYELQPAVHGNYSPEQYQKFIDFTVIQRKLHDAGAFAYTYHLQQNGSYLAYIDQAVKMALAQMKRYPGFEAWGLFFEKFLEE